uniref:pectinesterase n=1 Tax=Vitis vinifera TaxID=29760 RepID=A5AS54_VITVI|nr:hypothetical protein VITISV_020103 [Vitis vinifera]
MQCLPFLLLIFILQTIFFEDSRAAYFRSDEKYFPSQVSIAKTITVASSGQANFRKIQDAIDVIPSGNNEWIRVKVSPGVYFEKVNIPIEKPYIFLEGHGAEATIIKWGDHSETNQSATFTSSADNFVAKDISFQNSYNMPLYPTPPIKPAAAATIYGDKSAFYSCGFVGLQDTLWDVSGRHYFSHCYIEGAVDFICGDGQSFYENCRIKVNGRLLPSGAWGGYITAQKRSSPSDHSGFVFHGGLVVGSGKFFLGRAWGPYSRVIFQGTRFDIDVMPEGWDAWRQPVGNLVYVEQGCTGKGSDVRKRVEWQRLHEFFTPQLFLQACVLEGESTMGGLIMSQTLLSIPLRQPPSSSLRHRFSSCRWLNRGSAPLRSAFASTVRHVVVYKIILIRTSSEDLLNGFNSRCSITNTEVQFDQTATAEGVQEDLPDVASNCPVPIIHLKSDILETEPFNLLTEGTYVDSLLTALPVLSEEEQTALAATPAHPAGLYALYASSFAGGLVEQLWNFAWPAAIALLHPSLQPVAVIGFFTKLAVVVGGPLVGQLMDYFPRVPAYNCLNLVQATAHLLSVAMIIRAHTVPSTLASSVLLRPWFFVLVLAGSVERLSGLALGVTVERDWIVLLAGPNRPIALAEANAVLNRIDLVCELVLTWLTNKLSSGVLNRTKSHDAEVTVKIGVGAIKHGWMEYLQQPVLPASLAYVLLYFNVLMPGGLMTAFLTQRGLNPSIVGGFSGLCAFMGVAATFISANLVRRLGMLKAGAAGLIFQAFLLTIAVAVYWSGSLSQQTPLLFFLSLIILQTGIPSSKANLIGTTEASVASLAEFVMLGVAIIANDVSHFGFLAMLSLFSAVGAAWMFCHWLVNPTEEQRSLFSF